MSTVDEIRALYTKLEAEIAAVDAHTAALIARGKQLQAQIAPYQAELASVSKELSTYRGDDYREKRKLLGQLAVALGGKKIVAEPMP